MDGAFAANVDKQVQAAFTAPYRRVAGRHSTYEYIDVSSLRAMHHAAVAKARAVPVVERSVPAPTAVTTVSARELETMKRMNVPPRYAPSERFSQPLTASQEVGWRVGEALAMTGKALARR